MTFIELLQASRDHAREASKDPWRAPLEKLKGKVCEDRVERVSTQSVLDYLDVPQGLRSARTCRRLAKIMTELGWTPIRARGLDRCGYRNQVRGWARDRSEQSLF
jgi:hypothetical protein